MFTKRDITHPQGQKFGTGDLVRATDPAPVQGRPDLEVGALYRVIGSYAQRNAKSVLGLVCPSDFQVYEIVHLEREVIFAWIEEAHLELVPEKGDFNPFKWVRARTPW